MKNKQKIAVVTGSRADYGLLYWIMYEIQKDPDLDLQVFVTGMHLSPEFGLSYQLIEADGFPISAKIESQLSSDTAIGVSKSVGLGTIGFADAYANWQPDLVVLLGDRFEILAAAQAALFARIPIAHLYGGEVTEGSFDESIRHAITKMSHLHFVAAEPYRQHVIQLGEDPSRVFNVGVTGLDHILRTNLLDRDILQKQLNLRLGLLNLLVTYHPATLSEQSLTQSMDELLNALDTFEQGYIIFTKSNSDTGGRYINKRIDDYIAENPNRTIGFHNLGSLNYLSLLQYVNVVIGNSSSGIVEAPYFNKPTVNLGSRQKGRLRAKSIIDCAETKNEIIDAIKNAISLSSQMKNAPVNSPYGSGHASVKIVNIIKEYDFRNILSKSFYSGSYSITDPTLAVECT